MKHAYQVYEDVSDTPRLRNINFFTRLSNILSNRHRSVLREPEASWVSVEKQYEKANQVYIEANKAYDGATDKDAAEHKLKGPEKAFSPIKPLYVAFREAEDAGKELATLSEKDKVVQSRSDKSAKATSASDIAQANEKYAKLKDTAAY